VYYFYIGRVTCKIRVKLLCGTEYSQMVLNLAYLFVGEDSLLPFFIMFTLAQKESPIVALINAALI